MVLMCLYLQASELHGRWLGHARVIIHCVVLVSTFYHVQGLAGIRRDDGEVHIRLIFQLWIVFTFFVNLANPIFRVTIEHTLLHSDRLEIRPSLVPMRLHEQIFLLDERSQLFLSHKFILLAHVDGRLIVTLLGLRINDSSLEA